MIVLAGVAIGVIKELLHPMQIAMVIALGSADNPAASANPTGNSNPAAPVLEINWVSVAEIKNSTVMMMYGLGVSPNRENTLLAIRSLAPVESKPFESVKIPQMNIKVGQLIL